MEISVIVQLHRLIVTALSYTDCYPHCYLHPTTHKSCKMYQKIKISPGPAAHAHKQRTFHSRDTLSGIWAHVPGCTTNNWKHFTFGASENNVERMDDVAARVLWFIAMEELIIRSCRGVNIFAEYLPTHGHPQSTYLFLFDILDEHEHGWGRWRVGCWYWPGICVGKEVYQFSPLFWPQVSFFKSFNFR